MSAPNDNHALKPDHVLLTIWDGNRVRPRTCAPGAYSGCGAEPGTGRVQQYRTILVRQIDAFISLPAHPQWQCPGRTRPSHPLCPYRFRSITTQPLMM